MAAVGGEVVSADAVELAQGLVGAEVLVVEVGVADVAWARAWLMRVSMTAA